MAFDPANAGTRVPTVSPPLQDPSAISAPERALGQVGSSLAELGGVLRKANRERDIARGQTRVMRELGSLKQEAAGQGDPEAIAATWDAGVQQLRGQVEQELESADADHVARQEVLTYFDRQAAQHELDVEATAARRTVSASLAASEDYLLEQRQQAAEANSAGYAEAKNAVVDRLDADVEAGLRTPLEARNRRAKLFNAMDNARARDLVANDPQAARVALQDPERFPHLMPSDRAGWISRARQAIDEGLNRNGQTAREQATTDAVVDAMRGRAAIEDLPTLAEKHGLTSTQVRRIRATVEQYNQQQQAKDQRDLVANARRAMAEGSFTEEDLQGLVGRLPDAAWNRLRKDFERRRKEARKQEKTEKEEKDKLAYNRMLSGLWGKALAGDLSEDQLDERREDFMVGGVFKKADFTELARFIEEEAPTNQSDPEVVKDLSVLEAQNALTLERIMDERDNLSDEDFGQFASALQQQRNRARQLAADARQAAEQRAAEQKQAEEDRIVGNLTRGIISGEATLEDIAAEIGNIPAATARALINFKQDRTVADRDDRATYIELTEAIFSGQDVQNRIISETRAGNLTTGTMQNLLSINANRNRSGQAGGPDTPYERHRDWLSDVLGAPSLIGRFDEAQATRVADALMAYDDFAAQNPDATDNDLRGKAEELARRFSLTPPSATGQELAFPYGITDVDRSRIGREDLRAAARQLQRDFENNRIDEERFEKEKQRLLQWGEAIRNRQRLQQRLEQERQR